MKVKPWYWRPPRVPLEDTSLTMAVDVKLWRAAGMLRLGLLLLALVEADLPHGAVAIDLVVPYDRGDLVARAHREGELDIVEHGELGTRLVGRVAEQLASELTASVRI